MFTDTSAKSPKTTNPNCHCSIFCCYTNEFCYYYVCNFILSFSLLILDACVKLQVGEWGLSLGLGCQACACNTTGSFSADCDQDTGLCSCKPGVSGRPCNECAPGYFGFSSAGCQGLQQHAINLLMFLKYPVF